MGKINVVHLIYFKSKHNTDLSYLSNLLIEFRNTKTKLEKLFCKNIALIGMGRFAFNVSKHSKQKSIIINNYPELTFNLEQDNMENIDFYGNYIIGSKKINISNYENNLISARLKCSSLLFGSVNNRIRRECYDIYLKSKTLNNFNILRFDTDSFMISFPYDKEYLIKKEIISKSKYNYKLEYQDIDYLINLKKRSHYFRCNNKTIVKIPGLSMTVKERNEISINEKTT